MIEFKIGIIGAGNIAGTVADTLNKLEGFTPYAIASRDLDRAIAFGTEHDIKTCYGSYDELLADENVELVYIATVNSTHAEIAKKCIDAGKPCLVVHRTGQSQKQREGLMGRMFTFCTQCSPCLFIVLHCLPNIDL